MNSIFGDVNARTIEAINERDNEALEIRVFSRKMFFVELELCNVFTPCTVRIFYHVQDINAAKCVPII